MDIMFRADMAELQDIAKFVQNLKKKEHCDEEINDSITGAGRTFNISGL